MPLSNDPDKLFPSAPTDEPPAEDIPIDIAAPPDEPCTIPEIETMTTEQYEQQAAAAERTRAEIEQRDREFLAALDQVLEKQKIRDAQPQTPPPPPRRNIAVGLVKKGVGMISLALILIFMGVVMLVCLFSHSPDYLLPLKLSPLAAVLIGLELLVGYLTSGKHFRVHIPSIAISALLVVSCCIMAAALNKSYSATKTDYNNRSVAAEIYDSSYKELRYVSDISVLKVDVNLNPDGVGSEKGMKALSADDTVNIFIELGGGFDSPAGFAAECKKIIDSYKILGIPVTNFTFINEGRLHSFKLEAEGKFIQDYSESKLTELVSYVYIENYDYIHDLEDYTEPAEESSEKAV